MISDQSILIFSNGLLGGALKFICFSVSNQSNFNFFPTSKLPSWPSVTVKIFDYSLKFKVFSLASVDGNSNLTDLKWIPMPTNRQVVHNSRKVQQSSLFSHKGMIFNLQFFLSFPQKANLLASLTVLNRLNDLAA